MVVADNGIVLRSAKIVMRPKSAILAVPLSLTRMFAYSAGQQDSKIDCKCLMYPLQIPMNDPEIVKVGYAGHKPGELKVVKIIRV